jgi:hypothetical protein
MNLSCNLCQHSFKEGEEIMFISYAYWHSIPSRVNFGMTKPHDVDQSSFQHVACRNYYGEAKQP